MTYNPLETTTYECRNITSIDAYMHIFLDVVVGGVVE